MTILQPPSDLPPGYRVALSGAWVTLPWPVDPAERARIAEASLGPLLIRWAEGRVTEDELDMFGPGLMHHLTGLPWRFTTGQKKFLVLFYHFDAQGRFVYRSAVRRGAKGTGKDPFGAAWCNLELVGPSQLMRDEDGSWVGVPHRMPLVQIAANSEAQAKDVLRVANAMWGKNARAWHDLDCGETRTILKGRGRLEVLTASEASSEGDPATAIMLNESHHMTATSGGHRLTEVARRNVGKSPADMQARLIEFTNAHCMGMDSTAERSFEGWQKQQKPSYRGKRDILYDSIEADPNLRIARPADLRLAITQAYSDAPWADHERLADEVMDPRTSIAESIRYYLNGLAAREDAWIDPRKFDALARPGEVVADREKIAMFLDCSKSVDATGLVGCRLSDGHTFVLGLWQKPHGERGRSWLAPREEVDVAVRIAFDRYRVVWFGVDPSPARDDEDEALYWANLVDCWHRDFARKLPLWATPGAVIGHAVKFDMRLSQRGAHERNKAFTEMAELVADWIDEGQLITHDGDPGLRMHAHNARRRPNQWGVSLGKENRESKRLVDLAVCMVGAHLGRRVALNNPKIRTGTTPSGRVVILS